MRLKLGYQRGTSDWVVFEMRGRVYFRSRCEAAARYFLAAMTID